MFRWQNIMRFVNKETLLEEHAKQSRRRATGVDGVTKDEYDVDEPYVAPARSLDCPRAV